MKINEIESLTQKELEELKEAGKAELISIKDHDCYFVDLGEYFQYSVLVFKNNHHIYYANDYQLHHKKMSIGELKNLYMESLNNKLFTESELMEDVKTYEEYKRKNNYVRNYWIMQFDHVSMFGIGEKLKEIEIKVKNMLFCPACFCYVDDKKIVEKSNEYLNHIEKTFEESKTNIIVFREMIVTELSNHEAGYTGTYEDCLESLGLIFEDMTTEQKDIVKKELKKQINDSF